MLNAVLLLAQQQTEPTAPPWAMFVPLVFIMILMFWMQSRSQRKEQQSRQAMLAALKKNDKVVTSGGLIGIVAGIKENEDEVMLKVDENSNVRIRVTKSSILRILSGEEAAKEKKEESASGAPTPFV